MLVGLRPPIQSGSEMGRRVGDRLSAEQFPGTNALQIVENSRLYDTYVGIPGPDLLVLLTGASLWTL